jgi:two-component system, chemotaxis family, CheB/CheR fusion protein
MPLIGSLPNTMAKPRLHRKAKLGPRRGTRTIRATAGRARPKPPARIVAAASAAPVPERPDIPAAIVGVGASAGGLEAFSTVLEAFGKSSDLAFVFVQHLSPQHASALPELLRAKTTLRVDQATNGMRIEPGHVYVIPPNVQMEVVEGELRLLPRPTDRSQFTPIDFFLQSLARWAQDRAVGVILSGTASDGAAGIREIKAVGGITIAQAPDSAKHDGMPRAAIATGMIDLVLSPTAIGEHLHQVRRHPYLVRDPSAGIAADDVIVTEAQLRDVFTILRRVSGIDFKQYKTPTVRRRLLRRMALLRLTDTAGYVRHLTDRPAEARALSQDLLIHVTRFFRDPESFEILANGVFPELLRDRSDDPIRIWVPGCATGEEAYSVAMVLLETLGDRATDRRIQIFATDVSDTAIEQARTGTYPVGISADVSPDRLKRFFTKSDGGFRVVKVLRDMCVFARHDLTRDPPFSRLDFVLCRNVLIYLDIALQKRLISVFHYGLKSRGFLMLGPAETPGPQASFSVVDKKWRLFRKAPSDGAVPAVFTSETRLGRRSDALAHRLKPQIDGKTVQDEATRFILDRYGPPGVVLDSNLQILQFRGHTGRYLEAAAGEPNLNVLKMARGGLLHPLRTALQLAKRKARVVRKDHVLIQRNGDWTDVTLEVVPLTTSRGEHFLVLFNETPPPSRRRGQPAREPQAAAANRETDARIADLRRELAANREYLQSIIQELEAANEELQSANEEILSSNEELQSTNEELDTAKEELQSTNEELNTVNEELHSRNEELTRVNSDLTNLLGSVDIPIVIVGSDLAVRRFTPRAEQLFNLIPGDVGRPIGQIKPNFLCDDLEAIIRETIETISPRERELQDRAGRWLSLRIRPYKSLDNRLDGAVLSVFDVDAAKRHQAFVERSRDHFRDIVDGVREPLLVLDQRQQIRSANRSFYSMFGLRPQEAEGRTLQDVVGDHRDGALRKLLDRVVDHEEAIEHTLDQDMPKTGRRRLRLSARPVRLEDAQQGILLAIQDMTHAKGDA